MSPQRIAALVGVAPCNRERVTRRRPWTVWGGRTHVRTALDMRTLVAVRYHPVLTVWHTRLHAAGKAAKVALMGCRRKLLTILQAMVKHQPPCPPREVPVAYTQTRPR